MQMVRSRRSKNDCMPVEVRSRATIGEMRLFGRGGLGHVVVLFRLLDPRVYRSRARSRLRSDAAPYPDPMRRGGVLFWYHRKARHRRYPCAPWSGR
jgi:hypothetical protein